MRKKQEKGNRKVEKKKRKGRKMRTRELKKELEVVRL